MVGGVERVFELGRNFRNEGADATHNPEFTMLEAYQAYGDYDTMLRLTRELIQEAAIAAYGQAVARRPGTDEEVDISGDWPVLTVNEAVSAALGEEVDADTDVATLRRYCDKAEIAVRPEVEPRRGAAGALRAPGRGQDRPADVLHGLPDRGVAADPAAPATTRGWPSAGTWSASASRSAPRTRSWSTRSSSAAG